MSRTDLDAATLANSLRMKAGDGSMEWVTEPIQASVLLDIADMLDENAKLREYIERKKVLQDYARLFDNNAKLRKLCADMHVTLEGMNEQSFSVSGYVFCADVCPHWMGECSMLHPDECWYEQALRELGVEVPS